MPRVTIIETCNEYSPEFSREYEELGLCREDSKRFPSSARAHNGYKIPQAIIAADIAFWDVNTIDEDRVSIEELDVISAVFCDGFQIEYISEVN